MGKAEFDSLWAYMNIDIEDSPEQVFQRMLAMASTPEERIQLVVAANRDYLSYKCWEYERAMFAWKWREQF